MASDFEAQKLDNRYQAERERERERVAAGAALLRAMFKRTDSVLKRTS